MFKRFFKFFPPPQFLQMPAIGVDISDEAVRFIEFSEKKHGFDIRRYGEKKLAPGVVEGGYINNPQAVSSVLTEIRKEYGIRFVVSALPEEKVYLFKTDVLSVESKEIRENIELKMEENVPISPKDALFEYDSIKKDEVANKSTVSVSVAPTKVVETYMSVFRNAGLTPLSFETEGASLAQAVIKEGDRGTYLIVNVADRRTGFFIVSDKIVRFSSTVAVGGNTITDVLQKELGMSDDEIHHFKFEKGLSKGKDNEKANNILIDTLTQIKDEVNKVLVYWNTHGVKGTKIQKIILCGKNSMIKGFDSYLSVAVKTRVEVANVWVNVFEFEKTIPPIELSDSLNLGMAIGLTLSVHKHHV